MREETPSKTALAIARFLAYLGNDPQLAPLFPRRAAEMTAGLLEVVLPRFDRERKRWASPWMRRRIALSERLFMPGMDLHHLVRKRYLDDEVQRAVAGGAKQLLVLGAGMDTLAARLAAEHEQLSCIEIDHPATQEVKRRGLAGIDAERANLCLLPVDLAVTSLEQALSDAAGFTRGERTAVVAEGLLMYLPPREVAGLFDFVRSHSAAGSRFAFSYLRAHEDGTPYIGKLDWLVNLKMRWTGEPFLWGIAPNRLALFLKDRGFELLDAPEPEDLRERYLVPPGLGRRTLPPFERFAVAEAR